MKQLKQIINKVVENWNGQKYQKKSILLLKTA